MRKFKKDDFTWVEADELVSEASTLGMPPGVVMKQFEVDGIGVFTFEKIVNSETLIYRCVHQNAIYTARIFND